MRLFPYETFTLETRESLETVLDRLKPHIEKPRIFSRWNVPRDRILYAGKISETGFEVRRVIHYRNSFLPNIRGSFESSSTGTNIRIKMVLHPFVTVFSLFWFLSWYSAAIPIFFLGGLGWEAGLFLGMPMAIWGIFWFTFWYEVKRSRRELTAIILGRSLQEVERITNSASQKVWTMAIAMTLLINVSVFLAFFNSSSQPESSSSQSISCLHQETPSPNCNFSLFRTLDGHPTTSAIALSRDGKTLVSGGKDKAIKVWDLPTGTLKRTLQSDSGEIKALAIAPDGKNIISGSGDRMVRIWDITADRIPQMLQGHGNFDISKVAVSEDGNTIASGGYDEIKIWNTKTGELQKTFPESIDKDIHIGPITLENNAPYFHLYSISPNGKIALVESKGKFIAWDLEKNSQTPLSKNGFDRINSAQISWDSKTVVTTSYRQPRTFLRIWDLRTGILKVTQKISSSDRPDIALSRDRIFVRTSEGLQVFNLQTAELEAVLDHLESIHNFIISPDGKLLIGMTGNADAENVKIKVFQNESF